MPGPKLRVNLGWDEGDFDRVKYGMLKNFTAPPLKGDERNNTHLILLPGPKVNDTYFKVLSNWNCSFSFCGNLCLSCKFLGADHPIAKKRLFILGDQFIPPCIGKRTDCVPVLRVENGSFAHLRAALEAQRMHGFCPQDGAIFAVSLQAELARAGNESFWINFEEFKEWVSATFKATVMPFMTPYPNSTHIAYRTRFQQFLCELRLRWMGDLHGGIDWTYGLWRPLVELYIEEKVKFDLVPVPPVLVKEKTPLAVECEDKAWGGFELDFSEFVPLYLEKKFIPKLLKLIESSAPTSLGFLSPSPQALEKGYEWDEEGSFNPSQPSIHLFGSSILRDTSVQLQSLCEKKAVNITSSCLGGKFEKVLDAFPIPEQCHKDDVIVLHSVGNMSLHLKDYKKEGQNFHPVQPRFLNDTEVEALINSLISHLNVIRKSYKGRVVVVGPLPRYLNACCDDEEHQFVEGPIFSDILQYYILLNRFIAIHMKLRAHDFDFCTYHEVFADPFGPNNLKDGVHLIEAAKQEFGAFLAEIESWTQKPFVSLTSANPSFSTWAEAMVARFPWADEPEHSQVEDNLDINESMEAAAKLIQNLDTVTLSSP